MRCAHAAVHGYAVFPKIIFALQKYNWFLELRFIFIYTGIVHTFDDEVADIVYPSYIPGGI